MTTIDSSIMQNAANLKLIQQWGSGLEGVDIDEATKRGIAVANVPTAGTYNAESVAEWCVMAAIAISRSYPLIHKNVLKGGPWGYPIGESLIGKRVGIIGFGGIGKALALRLKAFGCEIVAVKRNSDETLAKEYGLKWVKSIKDLDELLYTSKYIFLCLPLNNESENLIGERELSIIKSGNNRYTFFIGSPGLATAISITFLLFLALYISTSINNIYIWFIYLFFCIIVLPFSLKVDRINQIRLLSMKLVCEAYVLLKKSNPSEIDIQNAKDLLIKSSKFVDEPAVVRQIQIIDTYLNNKKPL